MNNTREAISEALFSLLENNTNLAALIKTFTRVPRMYSDWDPPDQPVLTLAKTGPASEVSSQNAMGLTKWNIEWKLIIYARNDAAPGAIGETLLNNIADAAEKAIEGSGSAVFGNRQPLGGLVTNVWMEGPSMWDLGLPDDPQMVAMYVIKAVTGQ